MQSGQVPSPGIAGGVPLGPENLRAIRGPHHLIGPEVPVESKHAADSQRLTQPFLAFAQGELRLAPLDVVFRFSQGALDRKREARKAVLEHEIGRPALERLDGPVFTQRAGDEDEGDLRAAGPGQSQ